MIVVFGGAFNPPTIAHYEIAKHVLGQLNVEQLLFMPVGDQYKKAGLIPAFHRVKMLEILGSQLPNTSVSKIEVEAERPLKTIETLEKLRAMHPNSEIAFMMGADNLHDLTKWHAYERLVKAFKIIIFNRNGLDVSDIIKNHFEFAPGHFIVMNDFSKLNISSSQYRTDITKNELLLADVEKYIKDHDLY